MTRVRFVRRKPHKLRCKPTLYHLCFVLSLCLACIFGLFYVLSKINTEERNRSSYVENGANRFEINFLILPKTLPVAGRLLTVLVFTPYANLQSRLIIRNTWASAKEKYNASVFFVLTVPDVVTQSEHPVQEEAKFFNDIIQINLDENSNFSENWLKRLILALRFVQANLTTGYLLKVGQNMFVNLHKFTNYLATSAGAQPERFFVTSSRNFFFNNFSSRYAQGTTKFSSKNLDSQFAYGFSFDLIEKLSRCSVEDGVSLTNEFQFLIDCLRNSEILLRNVNKFLLNSNRVTDCLLNNNFVTHPVTDLEMENYWTKLKQNVLRC